MKINGILMLDAIVICSIFILSSQRSHAYPFSGSNRGIQMCSNDDECDYNELCSLDKINNEVVNRCFKNCRYPHRYGIRCVHPNVDHPECDYNWECAADQVCLKHKHKCVNACNTLSCGPNSFCIVVYERQTACRCLQGYTGNPYTQEGCAIQ